MSANLATNDAYYHNYDDLIITTSLPNARIERSRTELINKQHILTTDADHTQD